MSQDFYVTIETENVAEVTAVGIQGLSGVAGDIESISNVDTINAQDGSILVLNTATGKWVATRILEKQDINGGQY